jgi:hypothetical protein
MSGRFIKLASDWCATKGVKMSWAFVGEKDEGHGSKGSHVHILLHCPVGLPSGAHGAAPAPPFDKREISAWGIYSRGIGPALGSYASTPELRREKPCSRAGLAGC